MLTRGGGQGLGGFFWKRDAIMHTVHAQMQHKHDMNETCVVDTATVYKEHDWSMHTYMHTHMYMI